MSSVTVTFIGWNSSTRAWNTSTWNTSPTFDVTATGSVGQAVQEGDAIVSVTGVAGTGAVGDTFTTNMGVSGATSIGTVSITRGDNASVTGVAGTGAVGSTTVTSESNLSVTGVAGTASVNSASAVTVGNANVPVTGVSCSALVGKLEQPWGLIIPSQASNFTGITPTQSPSWADVAA